MDAAPVSPPRRRSTMHCSPSRAWMSYPSIPPTARQSASSISTPRGMSMEGSRGVTGTEEPARKAKSSSLEMSTISLAHSHFQERCLSLNTGTLLPLSRKTRVISLNHS